MVCTGMRTNVSFVKSMQQTWTILPHDGPDRLTNMADMRTGIRSNVSFPDWCADQRSSQLSLRRLCCTDYTADLPDECAPPLPPRHQRDDQPRLIQLHSISLGAAAAVPTTADCPSSALSLPGATTFDRTGLDLGMTQICYSAFPKFQPSITVAGTVKTPPPHPPLTSTGT